MSEKTAIYCKKCDGIHPCPVTGSEGNWYWSDEQKIHYRKRVRECSKCGSSFSTYEINYDSFTNLLKSEERVERYKRQVSESISNIAGQLDLLNIQLNLSQPLLLSGEDDLVQFVPHLSPLDNEGSSSQFQESYFKNQDEHAQDADE